MPQAADRVCAMIEAEVAGSSNLVIGCCVMVGMECCVV